ncbi:chondroitinase family polysaccharide lyase [Algibacter lectus]|nr:chondroitinase family polysaccharide lyase [Algibacter lectus]
MTSPQSMKWTTSQGASLTLDANIDLSYIWRNQYTLSVGLFQENIPTGNNKRVFKVDLLSSTNQVLHSRNIYMHKGGWNILCSELEISGTHSISKVRITQTAGSAGNIYIDNFLIYALQNSRHSIGSSGVEKEKLWLEDEVNYPTTALTQQEKDAFLTIAERVIPLPSKVSSISNSVMDNYRAIHARYNIETNGVYANGVNPPCYYSRSYNKLDQETVNTIQYLNNQELCKQMENMGKAWYQTNNAAQKEELGTMITDIVRLATTYGGMPNAWYNGRGFAEGVYYAKELLEENGLIDKATELIILQYDLDLILYGEHRWEFAQEHSDVGPEFFWAASADDLNTASKSTILGVLAGADNAEKARNIRRLTSWLDNIALNYSPSTDGTLKPDGSWFHHWG